MFNHLSDARKAALDLLAAVLGEEPPKPRGNFPAPDGSAPMSSRRPGLRRVSMRRRPTDPAALRPTTRKQLDLQEDRSASASAGTVAASRRAGCGWTARRKTKARACAPATAPPASDVAGSYRCAELDTEPPGPIPAATLWRLLGFLGQGGWKLLDPIGPDVWALPCPARSITRPPGGLDAGLPARQAGRSRASKSLLAGAPPSLTRVE